MTKCIFAFLFPIMVAGCRHEEASMPDVRRALVLDSLGIAVNEGQREYMLSDKGGGFVIGCLGCTDERLTWSAGGIDVLNGLALNSNGNMLKSASALSRTIYPNEVLVKHASGEHVTITMLDHASLPDGISALVVDVRAGLRKDISLEINPAPGITVQTLRPSGKPAVGGRNERTLLVYAGPDATRTNSAVSVHDNETAVFLLLCPPTDSVTTVRLFSRISELRQEKKERMQRALNRSYFTTNDASLDKAIHWTKLFLDGLIVESSDTFAVAGLPWDGSINCRDNAQSITGMGLATGEYETNASIIRSLVRYQDSRPASTTFGRIPARVRNNSPEYGSADVTPSLIRNMYEHVKHANDTSLVRALYPVVMRATEGTLKGHTDAFNFLVHGNGDTWMNAMEGRNPFPPRGNRAAEVQHLWYFQQLVTAYMSAYTGERDIAARFLQLAGVTSDNFNKVFIDTTRNLIYDHLSPEGAGVADPRPNPMMCLEIITHESVQQNMLRTIVGTMVYPYGVGTLALTDTRFTAFSDSGGFYASGEAMYNGPVWTWLTGQLVYALTRYDRQDIGYMLTESLIKRILYHDLAGALPAMLEPLVRTAESSPRSAGSHTSLVGMAEFLRSVYQDYLGILIDATANRIDLQPKLPDHLHKVDFTVYAGDHPLHGQYLRGTDVSRIVLNAPDIDTTMNMSFLWMLDDGDAWRGSCKIPPRTDVTVVITKDGVLLYYNQEEATLQSSRKLVGFSRRGEFEGLTFAEPRAR